MSDFIYSLDEAHRIFLKDAAISEDTHGRDQPHSLERNVSFGIPVLKKLI